MRIKNCVTRVTVRHHSCEPRDAEQLPEWRNFQFASKNHYGFIFLHTLLSKIVFKTFHMRYCINITWTIYMIGSVSIYDVDVETFGGKWRQNLTSCTRLVLHPSCKTTFPSLGRVHGNSGRVIQEIINRIYICFLFTLKLMFFLSLDETSKKWL